MPHPHHRLSTAAGFSLIELIVVIAIITLLLALLMPVLGQGRDAARQSRSMNNMRQMMLGYTVYQHDYRGQVLWGYTPPAINGVNVTVTATDGRTYGLPIADRYPWRLAPYVGNIWAILHSHATTVPPLPQASDSASQAILKAYTLSINPTFGINSAYVGGSNGLWAGFIVDANGYYQPNHGRHVVFRDQEVRRPTKLLVFSDSKARNAGFSDPETGMHFVTPPYANGHYWQAAGEACQILKPGYIMGVPEGRFSIAAVSGFFDGHGAALPPRMLDDMTLWANWADSRTDDFTP